MKFFCLILKAGPRTASTTNSCSVSGCVGFDIGRNGQPTDCPGKILFGKKKPFPMLHYELEVV